MRFFDFAIGADKLPIIPNLSLCRSGSPIPLGDAAMRSGVGLEALELGPGRIRQLPGLLPGATNRPHEDDMRKKIPPEILEGSTHLGWVTLLLMPSGWTPPTGEVMRRRPFAHPQRKSTVQGHCLRRPSSGWSPAGRRRRSPSPITPMADLARCGRRSSTPIRLRAQTRSGSTSRSTPSVRQRSPRPEAPPLWITAGPDPDRNLWFTERDGNKIGRITH